MSTQRNPQSPVGADVISLGRESGWLRRAGQKREPEEAHFRVTAFANQVEFIPGVTRDKADIARRAEELYGPAYNPREDCHGEA